MKISIIFLYFLLISGFVFAQSENLLKTLDKKIYNPMGQGLTYLEFDARLENLSEILKSETIIPNISDVYFKITWDPKKRFVVNIIGLPKGFLELKRSLESLIVDKLGFFIPLEIYEHIKDYSVSVKKNDLGIQYTLEDKTYLKEITKIEVIFDNDKKLNVMEFQGLNTRTKNVFSFELMDNSNKWLLKNFLVENIQFNGIVAVGYQMDYAQVGNYYFPKSIIVTTQLLSTPGQDGQKQILGETKSVIKFINFRVK